MRSMTRFISLLPLISPPAARDHAIAGYIAQEVLERCRAEIPGFVTGMLLKSLHDPDGTCVMCEWRNEQAFEDWMNSPVRSTSAAGLLFKAPGRSQLYVVAHQSDR